MTSLLLLPKIFIAGGAFLGAFQAPAPVDIPNHTLSGETIPSSQVVCRDRWGTPMLPNNKAGYSLIAPIKKNLIAQSLWIPPVSGKRPEEAKAIAASVKPVAPTAPAAVVPSAPAVAAPSPLGLPTP